jgi:hypothetical protein
VAAHNDAETFLVYAGREIEVALNHAAHSLCQNPLWVSRVRRLTGRKETG